MLQGASYDDEFAYREEMEEMASSRPDVVVYVPTVSRPNEDRNAGWTGARGRVNAIVEEYVDRFGLSPDDTMVYACGHPGMIEDVKDRLGPRGFHVMEERYWKQ